MNRTRVWLVVGAIVAAACGASAPATLTVDEYAEAMQRVETEFDAESPNPADDPADRDRYPLGGDLVVANELHVAFQKRLAGWRAIQPPPELAALHEELVAALEAVQQEVEKYLTEQAVQEGTLDFDTIGPKVEPFLSSAADACRALRSALLERGARVDFAANCQF